ncbi:hypothetical protein [Pelagibacterium mangrovi]|uniref:hypothetical protein n=1 Tax=Pelagibacterium mangrovi TaxID=3119828 RepID=UPI002FCCB171
MLPEETDEQLAALPVWQRTSTAANALEVSSTGAAILPKSPWGHDALPRVPGWQNILKAIGWDKTGFVADLLHDIEFQHHQSTNGRWNEDLQRWERWGVRSVNDWCKSGIHHGKAQAPARVCAKTFDKYKNRLVAMGLIVAEARKWQGPNHLWIKPTEQLSRIVFEPGYWEQVREQLVPAKPAKAKPAAKKPRGLSAKHKEIEADLRALYLSTIKGDYLSLDKPARWAIWDRLTKPIPIGKGHHHKKPYAATGSYQWKQIYHGLGLHMD